MPAVRVPLRPSLIIMSFLLLVHGAAFVVSCLLLPAIGGGLVAAGLVALGLGLSLVLQLRKERWKAMTAVEIDEAGAIAVHGPRAATPQSVRGALVGARLIALRSVGAGGRYAGDLLLAPDSAAPDGLRMIRQAITLSVQQKAPR